MTKLQRVLGVLSLIIFGLAYMTPLTVFTTYGVVTGETLGHLPVAYMVTLVAMFFTAFSYGCMVRRHPSAGSAYSYTCKAFGSSIGFIIGWALLLDYIFLPLINYLLIGLYLSEYFPAIPAPIWIITAIAIITVFNILGIQLAAKMSFLIIFFQVVFLVVFLALSISTMTHPNAPSLLSPFYSNNIQFHSIFAGAAILCFSFLGFDAISTLSEEAINPWRTVPLAIVLCTILAGVLFIIIAWAGQMAFPHWQEFKNLDTASNEMMAKLGGHFLVTFFTAAYITGAFASALASQISVVRILYSMGRDKVLPSSIFAVLSKKYGTPIGAALVVSLISLLALCVSLTFVINMISFGALVAFTFVNVSVVKIFIFKDKNFKFQHLIIYGLLPFIGFLFTLWLWTSLSAITFTAGLVWFVIGFIYLLYQTKFFKIKPKTLDMEEVL